MRWWVRLRGELAALLHRSPSGEVSETARSLLAAGGVEPGLNGPIFLTGRFRCGSTLLWNLYRSAEGYTAYYEPLNELHGKDVDPTHRGVIDYWREYAGVSRVGFDPAWSTRRLLLGPEDEALSMQSYIQELIDQASGRAVLQFNRVDFRLAWLRARFPAATVVHLWREPRAQWVSSLGELSLPKDAATTELIALDPFYLWRWVVDLQPHFPFLDHRKAEHPYQLYYYLWRLSWLFGQRFADVSLSLAELCEDPGRLGLTDGGLVSPPVSDRWLSYAEPGWFEAHEVHCEQVIADSLVA